MWVWLKLKLTPEGDFCVVSVRAFLKISLCTVLSDTWTTIITFHPKHPK